MNHLFVRSFLTTFCSALLCLGSAFIFAEQEEAFPEVMLIEQENENQVENIKEMISLTESTIGNFNDSYYLQRIHNDGYYHVVSFSDTGDIVQLHDGSEWLVEWNGQGKVVRWVVSDDIFIKPTASCFSSYKYVLHNRTTNQAVEVNFKPSVPLPMNAYVFRIINIEPYQGLVLLSDNTVWKVKKGYPFSRWQIGQRILVGVNNLWREAIFPHILINVDMSGEPYSQALFYGYPAGN